MKIHIRKYTSDLIPIRRLERIYEYWRAKDKYYLDESEYTWHDKIVFGLFDKLSDFFLPINRWWYSRGRKIKIKIDNYDLWSMDHTLALIIHPMLVAMKDDKCGSPDIANEDVPEHLRSDEHNVMDPETKIWDTDEHWHKRWEWVLDEMIWSFSQIIDNDDVESQFFKNGFDKDGYNEWQKRINNGTRLFGIYYRGLWT